MFGKRERVVSGNKISVLDVNNDEKIVRCRTNDSKNLLSVKFDKVWDIRNGRAKLATNFSNDNNLIVGEVVEVLQHLDNENLKVRFIENKRFGKICHKRYLYKIEK